MAAGMIDDLTGMLTRWPVGRASAAVMAEGSVVAGGGDLGWTTRIASIAKLLATFAGLVAIEEGTIGLDQPAGRPDATFRHLLAHAAGYAFDGPETIAGVASRRIYSNTGFEVFAESLAEAADMPFGRYLHEAVLGPLGMGGTALRGSPAHAVDSSVLDLTRFAAEVVGPRLIARTTIAEATTIQFPRLAGVLPGVGRFDPNPWGLGFEIKGSKHPHWSGTATSSETFGHFGGSGTFMWIDPTADLAVVALTDRPFDDWAMETWPGFGDEMVRRYGRGAS